MRKMCAVILLLCAAFRVPSGNSYTAAFRIPFAGEQTVRMDIINRSYARITLEGLVESKGLVEFHDDDTFVVHDPLLSLLNRYRCRVSEPIFNPKKNEAFITLSIRPLLWSKRLCLKSTGTFENSLDSS